MKLFHLNLLNKDDLHGYIRNRWRYSYSSLNREKFMLWLVFYAYFPLNT